MVFSSSSFQWVEIQSKSFFILKLIISYYVYKKKKTVNIGASKLDIYNSIIYKSDDYLFPYLQYFDRPGGVV